MQIGFNFFFPIKTRVNSYQKIPTLPHDLTHPQKNHTYTLSPGDGANAPGVFVDRRESKRERKEEGLGGKKLIIKSVLNWLINAYFWHGEWVSITLVSVEIIE